MTYDTAGVYHQYFPELGECGQLRIITLDFQTSTQSYDQLNNIWHPTLLRAGVDALVFHPRNNGTPVTVERLEVFDLNGRRVFTAGQTWLPRSSLPTGVYIFRARLKAGGSLWEQTGRVVVNR